MSKNTGTCFSYYLTSVLSLCVLAVVCLIVDRDVLIPGDALRLAIAIAILVISDVLSIVDRISRGV